MSYRKKDYVHISFEIGLLLKGIDSLLEILGGFILLFLNPTRLNRIILMLTQHELSEDPRDVVANLLVNLGHSFSISTQHFGVFYLLSHGIVKFILVILLWRKLRIAYPVAIVSLVLFIAYQVYRFTISQSVFLIFLTVLDIIMIVLTYLEYKKLKIRHSEGSGLQGHS